ncbi:MAG: hypothetical protein ACYS7M_04240 [Planctomycetota bacterium]
MSHEDSGDEPPPARGGRNALGLPRCVAAAVLYNAYPTEHGHMDVDLQSGQFSQKLRFTGVMTWDL